MRKKGKRKVKTGGGVGKGIEKKTKHNLVVRGDKLENTKREKEKKEK